MTLNNAEQKVYVALGVDGRKKGQVKIGVSANTAKRIPDLRKEHKTKCILLWESNLLINATDVEDAVKEIHSDKLSDRKESKEWFLPGNGNTIIEEARTQYYRIGIPFVGERWGEKLRRWREENELGYLGSQVWVSRQLGQYDCAFYNWENNRFYSPVIPMILEHGPYYATVLRMRQMMEGSCPHEDIIKEEEEKVG